VLSEHRQAEAQLDRARGEVATELSRLERKINDEIDWRYWVRRRPVAVLGAAAAVGFLLARLI